MLSFFYLRITQAKISVNDYSTHACILKPAGNSLY